jgi:hypothetical protein
MRRLLGLLGLVTLVLTVVGAACMPVGRDFARPTITTFKPGVSTLEDVRKVLGPPTNEVAWARNEGVLRQAPEGAALPTPFPAAPVGGTVRRLYYYYAWRAGEGLRPGVEPQRSLYAWFWNDKLVAFTGTSSFKTDATGFDDRKVETVKPWKSLRADVVAAFGQPNGLAVYPATTLDDQEVLIYRGFEWDTAKKQYQSKSLFVVVNGLGIVEDVRFSGSTNPIPPPLPAGGGVPIQIYTPPPPRTRGR